MLKRKNNACLAILLFVPISVNCRLTMPRKSDFSLDVEMIAKVVEQERPKCIFLTSPNNPDGSIIDDKALLRILDLPILVVLDEAYIESRMQWVKKHENPISLRTFSKRAGRPPQ